VSQTIWKKQVGTVQKKPENINETKKKKKGKSKKHLLTSMTSHVPKPKEDEEVQDDDE
jgi:hypothetical protein